MCTTQTFQIPTKRITNVVMPSINANAIKYMYSTTYQTNSEQSSNKVGTIEVKRKSSLTNKSLVEAIEKGKVALAESTN